MGRAQSTTVARARFDAIFGNRRGHGLPDISGQTLTFSGRERVERLLTMTQEEDFTDVLPELYYCSQYLRNLSKHPHLGRVILALVEAASSSDQKDSWMSLARDMLARSGAMPYHSSRGAPLHAARNIVRRMSSTGRSTLH